MKKRNPFIAGILSLLCPGLGQIYNSQTKFGFLIFITCNIFFWFTTLNNFFIFIIFLFGIMIISLFLIIYSFVTAKKIKEIQLTKFNKIYLYFFMIIISFILNSFILSNAKFETYNIPGGSMKPTLLVGDHIFVKKNYYLNNEVEYGDLIIFKTKDDVDFVKRTIGLPGDTIQIVNGIILLNNKRINRVKTKDFIEIDTLGNSKRIRKYKEKLFDIEYEVLDIMDNGIVDNTNVYKVPEDHYFAMGDNRDNSLDSRFLDKIGFIPKDKVFHKVNLIYWAKDKSRIGIYPK